MNYIQWNNNGDHPNKNDGEMKKLLDDRRREVLAKFDAIAESPEVNSSEVERIPKGSGHISRIIDWAVAKNLLGTYRNTDTGLDIELSKKGVRNVYTHSSTDGKIALLEVAPMLIRDGVFLEKDLKNPSLDSLLFAAKATIDGERRIVGFIVRKDINGARYYDHCSTTIMALRQQTATQAPKLAVDTPSRVSERATPSEIIDSTTYVLNILQKYFGVNS